MKKIHLGCGKKYFEGWVNIDADVNVLCDIYDDCGVLEKIERNSVDIIYACHILEHFGRNEYKKVLKNWSEKLKKGGEIYIAVPDFEKICEVFLKGEKLQNILGLIYGGQRSKYDYHKMTFTFEKLKNDLEDVGFEFIKKYDWQDFEMSHVDDYSKAYLPHMDFENGTLMSLNIKGIKK